MRIIVDIPMGALPDLIDEVMQGTPLVISDAWQRFCCTAVIRLDEQHGHLAKCDKHGYQATAVVPGLTGDTPMCVDCI